MSLATVNSSIRRTFLGGTDVAAIVGVSSFRSVHQVWAEKRGLKSDDLADNDAALMGKLLEVPIGRRYMRETHRKIRRPNPEAPRDLKCLVRHPNLEWAAGSPDYVVVGESGLMDCKSARFGDKWGDEGTDQVPLAYLVQGHWYLWLTGREWIDIATLFGVHDFRVFRIPRNEALEGILAERAARFWVDHVLAGVPPAPDDSEGSTELLKLLHPAQKDEILMDATDDDNDLALSLAGARREFFEASFSLKRLENTLRARIGDAAGITGTAAGAKWTVTWKKNSDGSKTDWEKAFDTLSLETQANPDLVDEVVRANTKTTTGSRVLRTDRKFFPQESTFKEKAITTREVN